MSVYQNLMGQIEEAGLLFNVRQARVFAEKHDVSLHGQ